MQETISFTQYVYNQTNHAGRMHIKEHGVTINDYIIHPLSYYDKHEMNILNVLSAHYYDEEHIFENQATISYIKKMRLKAAFELVVEEILDGGF